MTYDIRRLIVSIVQHGMNNGAALAIYCQILVEQRGDKRIINCARGRFPIAAGSDDLLWQAADDPGELAVSRQATRRP